MKMRKVGLALFLLSALIAMAGQAAFAAETLVTVFF